MNKENAKDYLPLVQALADGKTIQFLNVNSNWNDCVRVDFNNEPRFYRIKPEPRIFEMWLTDMGHMVRVNAMPEPLPNCGWTRITVQEVLE
jgi:hypothetical protein